MLRFLWNCCCPGWVHGAACCCPFSASHVAQDPLDPLFHSTGRHIPPRPNCIVASRLLLGAQWKHKFLPAGCYLKRHLRSRTQSFNSSPREWIHLHIQLYHGSFRSTLVNAYCLSIEYWTACSPGICSFCQHDTWGNQYISHFLYWWKFSSVNAAIMFQFL